MPLVFFGLIIGAMIPYWFSALTMKSVGKAALELVAEIRNQLQVNPEIKSGKARPEYERCVDVAARTSLKEMFFPGLLVILAPLITGLLLGPTAVAGLLPGIILSGVTMATSSTNSAGAWDNAKKYI